MVSLHFCRVCLISSLSTPVTKSDILLMFGKIPCIFLLSSSAGESRFGPKGQEHNKSKVKVKLWFSTEHFLEDVFDGLDALFNLTISGMVVG